MKLVLDASVAVAAARLHEPSHTTARARVARVLTGADDIVVPVIFSIEVAAALARVGEPPAAIRAYVDMLLSVAAPIAAVGPARAEKIRDMAIAAKLRAADATYVWLANRDALPLCTLDREMLQRGSPFCQVMAP